MNWSCVKAKKDKGSFGTTNCDVNNGWGISSWDLSQTLSLQRKNTTKPLPQQTALRHLKIPSSVKTIISSTSSNFWGMALLIELEQLEQSSGLLALRQMATQENRWKTKQTTRNRDKKAIPRRRRLMLLSSKFNLLASQVSCVQYVVVHPFF